MRTVAAAVTRGTAEELLPVSFDKREAERERERELEREKKNFRSGQKNYDDADNGYERKRGVNYIKVLCTAIKGH